MPFENLEHLAKSSIISDSTKKLYKSYLNKLAKQGFDTVKSLTPVKNQKEVIKFVKTLKPAYHKTTLTSIFYALSETDNKHKKHYYDYYQVLKLGDEKLQAYKSKLESEKESED